MRGIVSHLRVPGNEPGALHRAWAVRSYGAWTATVTHGQFSARFSHFYLISHSPSPKKWPSDGWKWLKLVPTTHHMCRERISQIGTLYTVRFCAVTFSVFWPGGGRHSARSQNLTVYRVAICGILSLHM